MSASSAEAIPRFYGVIAALTDQKYDERENHRVHEEWNGPDAGLKKCDGLQSEGPLIRKMEIG